MCVGSRPRIPAWVCSGHARPLLLLFLRCFAIIPMSRSGSVRSCMWHCRPGRLAVWWLWRQAAAEGSCDGIAATVARLKEYMRCHTTVSALLLYANGSCD